jgi:hypothetical protein
MGFGAEQHLQRLNAPPAFFLDANYRHLATQKNPVRLAEMIFVKKKILKSPYLDERKIEFRVYV